MEITGNLGRRIKKTEATSQEKKKKVPRMKMRLKRNKAIN